MRRASKRDTATDTEKKGPELVTLTDSDGRTWEVPASRLTPTHTIRFHLDGTWFAVHPITCEIVPCYFDPRFVTWRPV